MLMNAAVVSVQHFQTWGTYKVLYGEASPRPYPFIYLKAVKGALFGRSLPV